MDNPFFLYPINRCLFKIRHCTPMSVDVNLVISSYCVPGIRKKNETPLRPDGAVSFRLGSEHTCALKITTSNPECICREVGVERRGLG